MIIAGEKALLQVKSMALAYLLYVQQKGKTLTDANWTTEKTRNTEIFISEIDKELKSLPDE
jgi:hypothetical protein